MPVNDDRKYSAFISYRTAEFPDGEVGAELQKLLEAFRTPSWLLKTGRFPPKLKPVFRDLRNLVWTGDLDKTIKEKLMESDYLIVICSERSHISKWVEGEAEFFIQKTGAQNVILIRLDKDLDVVAPSAMPRPITQRYIDIRGESIDESLSRLKHDLDVIAARILGCEDLEELRRERLRQEAVQNQARLRSTIAISSIISLLAGAVAAGFYNQRFPTLPYTPEEIINPRTDQQPVLHYVLDHHPANLALMKDLIRKGASPEMLDKQGANALHHAVEIGRYSGVLLLNRRYPSLIAASRQGPSPNALHRAASKPRNSRIIAELTRGAGFTQELLYQWGDRASTPLQVACEKSDVGTVKAILAVTQDLPKALLTPDNSGQAKNALHHALARKQSAAMVEKILLADPALIQELILSPDSTGSTAFFIAVQKDSEAVESMISIDRDACEKAMLYPNYQQVSPLYIAIEADNWSSVRILIQEFPYSCARLMSSPAVPGQATILELLASNGATEGDLVVQLLDLCADSVLSQAWKIPVDGHSVVRRAGESGNITLLSYLMKRAKVNRLSDTPLGIAGTREIMQELVRSSSSKAFMMLSWEGDRAWDIITREENLNPNLFLRAVSAGNVDFAADVLKLLSETQEEHLLLSHDPQGNNALHLAAVDPELSWRLTSISFLRDRLGGKCESLMCEQNNTGDNPLLYLMRSTDMGFPHLGEIVDGLLLAAGSSASKVITMSASDGATCLGMAESKSYYVLSSLFAEAES